jgi:hypothetical protein
MKLNPNFQNAIAIDRYYYSSMAIYADLNKKVTYLRIDSQSPAFKAYIDGKEELDLVFLDGSHLYEGCKSDFDIVKEKAKLIAIHDILQREVDEVWRYIKNSFKDEFIFLEFTDQYLKEGNYLGIGLVIRKEMLGPSQ